MKLKSNVQLDAFPSTSEKGAPAVYEEVALHLGSFAEAMMHLRSLDWSFTDDNTRFLGHDLHPYPAKFIPQIPGTFISRLSSKGELVFDPFGGSGTTALEAIRMGRRAVSLDANPMAALIGRVKTARLDTVAISELHQLHAALGAFLDSDAEDANSLISRFGWAAPVIANREKWFSDEAFGELSHIRARINAFETGIGRDVANLSLSRTVLAASFQDSETRYKSVPRTVAPGETTRRYVREFEGVMRSVARNAAATRYGVTNFIEGDVRFLREEQLASNSVDLVVTSPPYGNATDYHLYHRFRLLWLGHDPIALGRIEIGSHLKHQRESSSFRSYYEDMLAAVRTVERVLKPGRFAAFVIGDSIYNGERYDTAQLLANDAQALGFASSDVFERPVHRTKRSFSHAGRRAANESLLLLQKKPKRILVSFQQPPYRLWPYEETLRLGELRELLKRTPSDGPHGLRAQMDSSHLHQAKSLVFTHAIDAGGLGREPTWQAILENGSAKIGGARKDPKYVTHGIHAYKGKFYPQLAKALTKQLSLTEGAAILDPFCGSGTTLLEGYLNGYRAFGCDMNPLGAHIAQAKTGILEVEPDVVTEAVSSLLDAIDDAPKKFDVSLAQFPEETHEELQRWFPLSVVGKLNWLMSRIRAGSEGVVRTYFEVVLSSIIRDVSQQDPSDLRIRYRKEPLKDAPVLELFSAQLRAQFSRLEAFWGVRGYAPNAFYKAKVVRGDNRSMETYERMGLANSSIDLVLTSPPYAMALPYIDTDRLSLLALFGLGSGQRRPIEHGLIGSRELSNSAKRSLEEEMASSALLPDSVSEFVTRLEGQLKKAKSAGFRRLNMPALIYRFARDMHFTLEQTSRVMKVGAEAMIVIGDSRMSIDGKHVRIPSTDIVESVANSLGLRSVERIDISVTTENLFHIKNAITENVVLRVKKS